MALRRVALLVAPRLEQELAPRILTPGAATSGSLPLSVGG